MSNRIPPSLSWLIKKRSQILGELISAEKNLPISIKKEKQRIVDLRANLASLDGTIRLHEIKLNPEIIEPTRPVFKKRFLPHGGYTKLVFELFRSAHPNPVSTDELALKVHEACNYQCTYARARFSTREVIKTMYGHGYITSVYEDKNIRQNRKGLWTLNTDRVQNTKKLVNSNLPATFLALTVAEPPA